MGQFNRLFERIFNSPRNFDSISFQKTKHLLIQFCILGVIGWIIFSIILVYDILNKQVFINNEIRDTVEVPQITLFIHEGKFDYYSLNNLTIDTNFNQLNYSEVNSCYYSNIIKNYNCGQSNREDITYTINKCQTIVIDPFNITFQETYLNLNFQTLVENSNPNLSFVLYFGDILFSFVGPMKIQLLFKMEIINKDGVETFKYIPTVVTSLSQDLLCETYNNTLGFIKNCSSNTLSVFYQSNIVPTYTLETGLQLFIRILIDTFSIGKLILVLVSLTITFFSTKFIFLNNKTDWFNNSIRDAVLFHIYFYILENDKPENKKKRPIQKEKPSKNKDEIESLLGKNDIISRETMGSRNKFRRLIQSIPPQDKYSIPLSRFNYVQYFVIGIVLFGVGIIIAIKDLQSRMITSTYSDLDFVNLPSFNFTFESVRNSTKTIWSSWNEHLPNGEYNNCWSNSTIDYNQFNCQSSPNYPGYTTFQFPGISYSGDNGSIALGRNQYYSLQISSSSSFISYQPPSKDLTYAILYLNEIAYYVRPYSNISIELTKSVFHQPDGTNITTYEPSITSLPTQTNTFLGTYSGETYIFIWYSSNVVNDIYQETNLQLLQRTATDFFSFVSPITTIVGLLFTKIIVKFCFKYSTAHVEFSIREAIIYHLRNYEFYKPIFRTKRPNN
ncbi:hypothetical protein ACTA71_001457 [Dictyostelium dimigraforme]